MRGHQSWRSVWIGLLVGLCGGSVACRTDRAFVSPEGVVGSIPQRYMDLCWPPGTECQHRDITQNELTRISSMISNINVGGGSQCVAIQDLLMSDMYAGRIQVWTAGSSTYDPSNFYGDRHNGPGITHLTSNAFASNCELMRTLIHESAHGIGVTSDPDATQLEDTCLGLCQ